MSALITSSPLTAMHRVARAKGVFVYDDDGRDYLDGSGGAMTVSIGHGVPEVLAAMREQSERVCYTFRTHFGSDAADELAETLVSLAPGDIEHAFFVNSGSEATEMAMRTAVTYWRERGLPSKTHVLGRHASYHGMTMGALSVSGHDARRMEYSDLLHSFDVAPPPTCFRCESNVAPIDCPIHGAGVWDRVITDHGADRVAAVIVEPIVGAAGGVLTPPIGYLRQLREICDRHDVLLIADEVITGIGRTGRWFGCEHDGIVPDMISTAKGMSSGYTPMGAVLFRKHVVDALRARQPWAPLGHTFSANPLSAATCLAVVNYMRANDLLSNAVIRGEQLEEGLRLLSSRFPWMADVRGRGLLWGFEFVTDMESRRPIDSALLPSATFVNHCFDAGLIVYPAGFPPYNNAIIVSPPLVITESEMDTLLERLEIALRTFGEVMSLPVHEVDRI